MITNKRAFVLGNGKIKNYPRAVIEEIEKKEKADGSGSVFFSSELKRNMYGTYRIKLGFIGVKDVSSVEKFIRELKHNDFDS